MNNTIPIPKEPGIYWCRRYGSSWITATLQKTGIPSKSGCDILVLPDNKNFDVRDYVTNYIHEGWEFRKATPPNE